MFERSHIQQIGPHNIYISNLKAAKNRDLLRQRGITHVISIGSGNFVWDHGKTPMDGPQYWNLHLVSGNGPLWSKVFPGGSDVLPGPHDIDTSDVFLDFIGDGLKGRLLLHGMDKGEDSAKMTPTKAFVICGILMQTKNYRLTQALKRVFGSSKAISLPDDARKALKSCALRDGREGYKDYGGLLGNTVEKKVQPLLARIVSWKKETSTWEGKSFRWGNDPLEKEVGYEGCEIP